MRKLLSIGAALAVAFTVTVGSAWADDSNNDNGGSGSGASGSSSTSSSSSGSGVNGTVGTLGNTVTGVLGSSTASNSTSSSTSTTATVDPTPPHHPHPGFPGGHRGNDGWYPGIPYGFPQLIGGTYLPLTAFGLQGVGNVDVCSYSTWTSFDRFAGGRFGNRWGSVRGRFGNQVNTWSALRQAARCGNTVVIQQQLPTLIDGSYLSLNSWGLNGNVSVCQYPTFDSFSRVYQPRFGNRFGNFRGRFGNDLRGWNAGWNHLRLQGNCAPSVVVAPSSQTIVQDPAPATTVEAAPQLTPSDSSDNDEPSTSTPQVTTVPKTKHGVSTGDGSFPLGL